MTGWNPGALRLVANTFRARSLAQCDRNSVFLLHLDGWRKTSVPFVTILESVSLLKYWSTDWKKLFYLHGLQVSEGFNSPNSETLKNFPSPLCYWINLKLRCLFVQLLTKYFKTRLFLNLVSFFLKLLLPLLYTPDQTWRGDFKQLAEIVVWVRWKAKHALI